MKLMDLLDWEDVNAANLDFYKAIGVECLIVRIPAQMADGEDHSEDFKRLKKFVADHGLELEVLHSHFIPRDKIIHGLPGRDEQIEAWGKVLRAIGVAGIGATATTFYAISHFRSPSTTGRGGAKYSTFDYEEFMLDPPRFPDKEISEERLWENIRDAVLPRLRRRDGGGCGAGDPNYRGAE